MSFLLLSAPTILLQTHHSRPKWLKRTVNKLLNKMCTRQQIDPFNNATPPSQQPKHLGWWHDISTADYVTMYNLTHATNAAIDSHVLSTLQGEVFKVCHALKTLRASRSWPFHWVLNANAMTLYNSSLNIQPAHHFTTAIFGSLLGGHWKSTR